MHQSLSPITNIILTLVWVGLAALLFFILAPGLPLVLALIGGGLGAIGGIMQHLGLQKAEQGFIEASSLMEVRRAFKSTFWGKRYLWWLYLSKFILALSAYLLIHQPLLLIIGGYLAGYLCFMFMRELITLKDTFRLKQISSNSR